MSEPVAFISRFRIKAGQRPAYEALAADATPRLQAEKPQTLVFLSYVGDEELLTIIHVFADAESMDRHFEASERAALRRCRCSSPWAGKYTAPSVEPPSQR
jgi:quinol monooxygenase YgiN